MLFKHYKEPHTSEASDHVTLSGLLRLGNDFGLCERESFLWVGTTPRDRHKLSKYDGLSDHALGDAVVSVPDVKAIFYRVAKVVSVLPFLKCLLITYVANK
jgi:hypothetical protein